MDLNTLIASYLVAGGTITVVDAGVRAVAPAIMRNAEKGATLDDFVAAHRFGLITRATPPRG